MVGALIADTSLLDEDPQKDGLVEHYEKWRKWRATEAEIPRDTA